MRRPPKPALLAACLSLLGLQLTGLHLHANEAGFDPVPHGMHVHGVAHHHDVEHAGEELVEEGHDHEGDRDVDAVELGTGGTKLPVFLPTDRPEFHTNRAGPQAIRVDATRSPITRILRWRPPLRGPPRLSV